MGYFSVLMPTYNCGKYISQSIKSILNQTYKEFEFIIIDDGSTDNTEDIVRTFQDGRINYKKIKHNGQSSALNFGISIATGDWIAIADDDDIAVNCRFKKQFNLMISNSDIILCSSYYNIITDEGDFIGIRRLPESDSEIRKVINKWDPFCHPASVFKKEIAIKAGGYPQLKNDEDWEFWKKIINYGKVCNIPEPLINYRIRNYSRSNDSSESGEGLFNFRTGIFYLENGKNKTIARNYIKKSITGVFDIRRIYNYLLTYLPFNFIYFFKFFRKGFSYIKYLK